MGASLGKNRSWPPALKICGLKDPDQALAIAALGVQAIGVIGVPDTPRYLDEASRRELFQRLEQQHPELLRVWVIANLDENSIAAALSGTGTPNVIQLHGSESLDTLATLKRNHPDRQWWKALRVRNDDDLQGVQDVATLAHAVLLDAWSPDQLGGTGHRLPLELVEALSLPCPWWLAGGVSAEWIPTLLDQAKPDGLDASSRLEISPGNKDLTKVEALVQAVRRFKC